LVLVLYLIVDLLGIIGAVMVAVPFLREHKLKELLDVLGRDAPIPGLPEADRKAKETVRAELVRFRPGDGACVAWGVVVIGASYGLHIVAELLGHFGKH